MSKEIKYTDVVPNSIVTRYKEDNIQYLLDQVARLTAENAMLKEKWSTPKQPEQEPVAWMWEFAVRSSWDASFTGEWKEEISRSKPITDGIVKGFNPTKLERTVRNLIPLYKAHGIVGGE